MRLYPQIYPVGQIQPSGALLRKGNVSVWDAIASRSLIVQSNMHLNTEPEPRIDINAIEHRARAARSAWIGSKLKAYYQALVRKFERAGEAGREDYLAASQSLADLEERIRRYERSKQM
ncbi:MAG: hypothetical protein IH606_09990 [Burkholderiales bacterium]|nr:hypothetical protein [Burkholderiales bacterium]